MNFSTQVISRRTIPQKGNPGTSRDRKLSNMEFFSPETHTIGTVISESRGADTVISDLNFQTPRAVDNPQETLQTNTDSSASGKTVNSVAILHIPYDFWSLSGGAIFDEFTSKNGKKNQMGYVARFVLSSITKNRLSFRTIPSNGPDSTENWQEYLGSKLADLKKERTQQKNFFVKLCDNYPEFLQKVRELCVQWYEQKIRRDAQKSSVPAPNECDDADVLDVAAGLIGRVAHLVVEDGCKELVDEIFRACGDRSFIDNKAIRVGELWETITNNYFNSSGWILELFDESRTGEAGTSFINPSEPPATLWSPEQVRKTFNFIKSKYSLVYDKFHSSGNLEGGGQDWEDTVESDDIFYSRFATYWCPAHARALLYVHVLFKRSPPSLMLRLLKHAHQLEVGVKGHEHHYQDEEDKPPKGKSVVDISKIMDTVVTKLAPPVDKAMASSQKEALESQKMRDEEITTHFKLQNSKLRSDQEAAEGHKLSSFVCIEDILRKATIDEQNIQLYAQKLRQVHCSTPFMLCQATSQILTHSSVGIPFFHALAIEVVIKRIKTDT